MTTSTTNQIADYAKYANLQMAAEALYQFKATGNIPPVPGNPTDPSTRFRDADIDPVVLTDGNLHSSKFVPSEAEKLSADWKVIDHIPDTKTGFSGTLFQAIKDDPSTNTKAGDLVLSFRSTEFIDDAARDNTATNKLEIHDAGFAMGQIDDMQAWYENLKTEGSITGPLTVTGYSLGGHLATAFNLLHQGDLVPNTTTALVKQVYTFNGAGIGRIDGQDATTATLQALITEFHTLRTHGDMADKLQSDQGRAAYQNIKAQLAANQGVPTEAIGFGIGGLFQAGGGGLSLAEANDRTSLQSSFARILDVQKTLGIVALLSAGNPDSNAPANPAQVPASSIEALSLDYQLAVLMAQKQSNSAGLSNGNNVAVFIVHSRLRPASNHPIWDTRSCA